MSSANKEGGQQYRVQSGVRGGLCVLALLGFAAGEVLAHEDPHNSIEQITHEIEKDLSNTELYLTRGELYRDASNWERALADFDRIVILDPAYDNIDFHRGRLMFDAGWTQRAKDTLDHFLTKHPRYFKARIIRARTFRKLGYPLKSVEDYSHALSVIPNPAPVLFVERAEAMSEAGEAHLDAAIGSLDEAIEKFGSLVVLESAAIDLEIKRQRYDAALERIDRLLSKMPRKEKWLARRGMVLLRAGRRVEARAAYNKALAAIETLPPRIRQVRASRDLEAKLRSRLEIKPF